MTYGFFFVFVFCFITSPGISNDGCPLLPFLFPGIDSMDIMMVSEKWAVDLAESYGLVKERQSGAIWPSPTYVVYGLFQAIALSQ